MTPFSTFKFQADNIILKERKLNIAPAIKKQVRKHKMKKRGLLTARKTLLLLTYCAVPTSVYVQYCLDNAILSNCGQMRASVPTHSLMAFCSSQAH